VYETLKKCGFISIIFLFAVVSRAQPGNCVLKPPQVTINFGTGLIRDPNSADLSNYFQVPGSCPTDGHYSLAPYTSGCFRGDWHTLTSDHTAGDADGNMLLVNAAPDGGVFLNIPVDGLKSNTKYELALYVINLCRPTPKCPSLLLPSLSIRLETADGKRVANIVTRDLPRVEDPVWNQHSAFFTTPASASSLRLVMADNAPGGCGNDFALDDITFRECVPQTSPPVTSEKKQVTTKQVVSSKPVTKKFTPPAKKKAQISPVITPERDAALKATAVVDQPRKIILPAPMVLKTRENPLVRKFETEAGEIKINLYDNGEIDGDTVSIYHNNELVRSHMRLSQKPITFTIGVNASEPYHELVMVADNLGSMPPNTSVMIITTPAARYQVFISSNEQKNAKVVFELKK